MTALERLKNIDKKFNAKWNYGPFMGIRYQEGWAQIPEKYRMTKDEIFLLHAFKVMREIATELDHDGYSCWCGDEVGIEFEKRMLALNRMVNKKGL